MALEIVLTNTLNLKRTTAIAKIPGSPSEAMNSMTRTCSATLLDVDHIYSCSAKSQIFTMWDLCLAFVV